MLQQPIFIQMRNYSTKKGSKKSKKKDGAEQTDIDNQTEEEVPQQEMNLNPDLSKPFSVGDIKRIDSTPDN